MSKTGQKHIPLEIRARARELRQPQTPAEARLWACLRDRRLAGAKFRRQHPLGRLIVDFYCPAAHLVVEVDGESHLDQVDGDATRTTWLEAAGHRVVRVTNQEVRESLEGCSC